jgi:hypothetical protein
MHVADESDDKPDAEFADESADQFGYEIRGFADYEFSTLSSSNQYRIVFIYVLTAPQYTSELFHHIFTRMITRCRLYLPFLCCVSLALEYGLGSTL